MKPEPKKLTEGQRMARKRRGGQMSKKKQKAPGLPLVGERWARRVEIARRYE